MSRVEPLSQYRQWIEGVTGHRITSFERLSVGASRGMFFVTTGDRREHVLRLDLGVGPLAGSELTLKREAEVYRALSGGPIPVAEFRGLSPDADAFLMGRVRGTHDLATLTPKQQEHISDRLMDALADLHRVDATGLDLPSFERPRGSQDHALLEVELWERILRQRVRRPSVLGFLAVRLLRDLAPSYDGPTVLCHGDVGPKNFMFADGEITALVDWETSHLGDPMDDLAWWAFRGHEWLSAPGSLGAQLDRWSDRSGIPIDRHRITYYRALVILRWYVMCRAALDHAGTEIDRMIYLSLVPLLDIKLSVALAGLLEADIGPYPPAPEGGDDLGGEVAANCRSDLEECILPSLHDAESARRARSLMQYVEHLAAIGQFGAAITAADRDDLSIALGRRVVDAQEGERSLHEFANPIEILRYTMRRAVRRAYLWPGTRDRALSAAWTTAQLIPAPVPG